MPNQISKRRAMLRKEHYENLVSFTFPGWPSFQRDFRNSSNSPASIKPFPRKWNHNTGIRVNGEFSKSRSRSCWEEAKKRVAAVGRFKNHHPLEYDEFFLLELDHLNGNSHSHMA